MNPQEHPRQPGLPEDAEPAHDRGKPDTGAIIALLNKVLALLKNEAFGLEEIKREVALVEGAVTSPEFGLGDQSGSRSAGRAGGLRAHHGAGRG